MENAKLLTTKDIHLIVLQNPVHLFTIFFYGLICSLCIAVPYASLVAMGITVVIMLFYYIVQLFKNIWFWLIVIGCIIFPPAAPFVVIIMVLLRMRFLFQHKKAIFYGIIIYLVPLLINYSFTNMGDNYYSYSHSYHPLIYITIFFSSSILIHCFLISLYKRGYVLKNAIILMLEFPVLFILLIISVAGAFDGHLFDKPVNDTHFSDAHYYDSPGVHEVQSYVRHGANGDLQFVNAHLRTNPDGILENNFSYKG
jgi:hypothetical protein